MICIEKTTRDGHVVLCIQDFSSLLNSDIQAPLHILHQPLEGDVLAMTLTSQQADGVRSISGFCAFLPLMYTPPQVDIFGCKNRNGRVVGRRQRPRTSLAWYRFLSISFTQKALVHFFIRCFYFAHREVLTYFCSLNIPKNRLSQRTAYSTAAPVMRDGSIYGGDQEKGGDRKSDKTKTDKTKSDKSKRENDKGLKKVKPPKRDGLASIL